MEKIELFLLCKIYLLQYNKTNTIYGRFCLLCLHGGGEFHVRYAYARKRSEDVAVSFTIPKVQRGPSLTGRITRI